MNLCLLNHQDFGIVCYSRQPPLTNRIADGAGQGLTTAGMKQPCSQELQCPGRELNGSHNQFSRDQVVPERGGMGPNQREQTTGCTNYRLHGRFQQNSQEWGQTTTFSGHQVTHFHSPLSPSPPSTARTHQVLIYPSIVSRRERKLQKTGPLSKDTI